MDPKFLELWPNFERDDAGPGGLAVQISMILVPILSLLLVRTYPKLPILSG